MLNKIKPLTVSNRGFKNFGHKRVPESRFTTIWHGFLTFTFIGMAIEWKKISKFFFGKETTDDMKAPFE